jgi:hypothetical protein
MTTPSSKTKAAATLWAETITARLLVWRATASERAARRASKRDGGTDDK